MEQKLYTAELQHYSEWRLLSFERPYKRKDLLYQGLNEDEMEHNFLAIKTK